MENNHLHEIQKLNVFFSQKEKEYLDQNASLAQSLGTKQSEVDAAQEELQNLKEQATELKAQADRVSEHLATLAQREKEFADERKQSSDEKHALELKNRDLSHLITAAQQLELQLRGESALCQQMLSDLSRELTRLQNSWSWKLTAPLRAIGSLLTSSQPDREVAPTVVLQDSDLKQTESAEKRIPNYKEPIMPLSLPVAATSIDELLASHDAEFVQCAYMTLLGRMPDPDGMHYYYTRLRLGYSKIAIIDQISSSVEAKNQNISLSGLKQAVRKHRWQNIPLIGILFRRNYLQLQINRIEANLYHLEKSLDKHTVMLDDKINTLIAKLNVDSNHSINENQQLISKPNPDQFWLDIKHDVETRKKMLGVDK